MRKLKPRPKWRQWMQDQFLKKTLQQVPLDTLTEEEIAERIERVLKSPGPLSPSEVWYLVMRATLETHR